MWPHPPVRVCSATTRGALYDLGPYPAMGQGEAMVEGELWFVSAEDMAATLAALDAIECYGQGDVDLYVRQIVTCRDEQGHEHSAWTYFYASEDDLKDARRVTPNDDGVCRWSAAS